jgi:hypothetical protein
MIRFALALALAATALHANRFPLNQKHRLFADQVNVRAEPSDKGRVMAVLPIGTEVTPLEEGTGEHSLKGLTAPWYKVAYRHQGKAASGFVWGGLIAKGFRESGGLLFLYGIALRDPNNSEAGFSTLVRVARANKQIASAQANEGVGFDSSAELTLAGGRGLKTVQNIFVVHFQQEYCGGAGNRLFFFWDGRKLQHVHSSVDGADAPVYATEKQVFPDEKGGRPDHIRIQRESGDMDNPASVEKEDFWLRWSGSRLEKAK